jgi:hypothetical protein
MHGGHILLTSKQIRKVLCMISHTLSLLRSSPTGVSMSVLNTDKIFMSTTSSALGSTPTNLKFGQFFKEVRRQFHAYARLGTIFL